MSQVSDKLAALVGWVALGMAAAAGLTAAVVYLAGELTVAGVSQPGRQARVETIVDGLDTVWELAWGPDGRLYLTERPGRIRVWDGQRLETLARLPVAEAGEAGLMGLALHPRFPREPYLFVCYTYSAEQGAGGIALFNRVARLRLVGGRPVENRPVLDGMRGGQVHDGCRLAFAPDGTLFVTMGDAGRADLAQQLDELNGKVLRVDEEGRVPPDNPFPESPVWSLGHRNPQGLAVRPGTGEIYVSEHGPDTDDEINRLLPGRNYGWPVLRGRREAPGYEPALWAWTPTIAPAGLAFTDPSTLYMATLKEGRLHRLTLSRDGRIAGDEVVLEGYGRLRAVTVGPDSCLYVGTSNRDGRGRPAPGDDRVLRICP